MWNYNQAWYQEEEIYISAFPNRSGEDLITEHFLLTSTFNIQQHLLRTKVGLTQDTNKNTSPLIT